MITSHQTAKNKIEEFNRINYSYELIHTKVKKIFPKVHRVVSENPRQIKRSKKHRRSPSNTFGVSKELTSANNMIHKLSFQFSANKTATHSFTKRKFNHSVQEKADPSDIVNLSTERTKFQRTINQSPNTGQNSVLHPSNYGDIESILTHTHYKQSLVPPLNLKTHEFNYPAEELSSKRSQRKILPKSKMQSTSEVSESKQPKESIKYSKLLSDLK
jgi:hypothetical protein